MKIRGVTAITFLVILIFFLTDKANGNCETKSSCSECITTKDCAWCSKVNEGFWAKTSQRSVCRSKADILEVCEYDFIENPRSSFKVIASRMTNSGRNGDSVQIRPQEVSLKLKPGEEFTLDIEFRKSENYPIDLYYLMDFSSSMAKYKNDLSKLGNKLAETMKNLTTDFQLGFGSFVDKVVLPFTSTLPSHLKHPCPKCRSPYSFKNHMSLSKETERFSGEVYRAEMSGNIDTPEGVFDGLMQAMACQKQLNWREKARHIIVVSTDAPFHLAGDGKLGGVIEPHDGMCYLNEKGDYTHSLVFDYPSVSQINFKALENNMNIIFAVVNKVRNEYQSLSEEIRGSSLGLLDAGENIADLIKAQYEKITTTVRLTENSRGPVTITFSSRCNETEKWQNTNECTDVKGGSVAYFKAHISVSHCSEKQYNKQDIIIKPVGVNETLVLHLETICECECSVIDHPGNENNSSLCSNSGDLICGECICHTGKLGSKCECDARNRRKLDITDTQNCVSNDATKELCSGRGECRCGVCQCMQRSNPKEEIFGKFCECDNFSCERENGMLCSGHGTCKCGKCTCDYGWSGSKCDCRLDDELCKPEQESEVCSGKGNCVCGKCFCQNGTDSDPNKYSGKYCQNCMTCSDQCDKYNECVECYAYKTGIHSVNNCGNCSLKLQLNILEILDDFEKNKSISEKACVSLDQKGCSFKYIYDFDDEDNFVVWAEKTPSCPKEVNLIAVIAGTIGGTVLAGVLALIAWRVTTDFYDKMEYEKFERERHLAHWGRGENPLFKTATTKYENPTYVKDSCQLPEIEEEIFNG